jgi:hypothetical protein
MPYTAEISRRNPSAILFVIDQSGSMAEHWNEQITKAQAPADAVNRLLQETIIKCSKEEGVCHYFDVGVRSYSGETVRDALSFIPGGVLKPVYELERNPLRLEECRKALPDGAGGSSSRRCASRSGSSRGPMEAPPCAPRSSWRPRRLPSGPTPT